MALMKLGLEPKISNRSQILRCVKKLNYPCNCKSEINNVRNALEGYCLEAMKIVHHHASGRFDWLISRHQSVNPWREAISVDYCLANTKDLYISPILW